MGAVSGVQDTPKSSFDAGGYNEVLQNQIGDQDRLAQRADDEERNALGMMDQVENYDQEQAATKSAQLLERESNDPLSAQSKQAQQTLLQYLSPETQKKFDVSKLSAAAIQKQMPILLKQQENEQKYGWEQRKFEQQQDNMMAEKAADRSFKQATLNMQAAESRANREAKAIENEEKKKANAIAEKSLSEGKIQRLDNIRNGLTALAKVEKAMDAGENKFSLIGDNNYTAGARLFNEMLGRMQSGGAIGKDEEKRFSAMLPTSFDSEEMARSKIKELKDILKSRFQTLSIGSPGIMQIAEADEVKNGGKPAPGGDRKEWVPNAVGRK
jgi:hypothetical protein